MQYVALIIPAWAGARNGYKQVATLALSSPVLLDTLISVSTIYMHLRGIVPQSVALHRQSQALASLRRNISMLTSSEGGVSQDAACLKRDLLATILLQITVEMANGTSTIRTHLSYALRLFQELGYERSKPTSSIGVVLVQRITCIDVFSSIFWHRRPLIPSDFWFFNHEEYKIDETTPSFQETTGCPLWVVFIMSRISHLVADIQDGAIGDDIAFPRAMELESSLTELALFHFGTRSNPRWTGSKLLHTVCECYYWSAVIILQRRVFKDPRTSQRVQFCLIKLIDLLESLPLGCGPDSQLSLPLYIAAHVAMTSEHRCRLRAKSSHLSQIYPLKTRTVLTDAFEHIWAVADAQAEVHWEDQSMAPDLMKDEALFIC